MSAVDLFNSAYDVEFRLKGTYIVVGKMPLYVHNILCVDNDWRNLLLSTQHIGTGVKYNIPLKKLPISAMTNCPSGYQGGTWYTRGPARHRHQGITKWSWWRIEGNGYLEAGSPGDVGNLLVRLLSQPSKRKPGEPIKGVLTRDVFLESSGTTKIRGLHRGVYEGNRKVAIPSTLPPYLNKLLLNAGLKPVVKNSLDKDLRDINEVVAEPPSPAPSVTAQMPGSMADPFPWPWSPSLTEELYDPSDFPPMPLNAASESLNWDLEAIPVLESYNISYSDSEDML